jgi:hypothetical protein
MSRKLFERAKVDAVSVGIAGTAATDGPAVVITGGAAAFPFRDFLTRSNVPFEYRDDEGPAGTAVCTLEDGTCLVSPTLSSWPSTWGCWVSRRPTSTT